MNKFKWLKWIVGAAVILAAALVLEHVRDTGAEEASQFWLKFPAWQVIRISGLLSYFLLFLGISLGLTGSLPLWNGKQRAGIYQLHSFTAISGVFFGMFHAMFLVIDRYLPFSWTQLLIPFTANSKPVIYGLGTVTLYGLLILILTADLRSKLSKKVWRGVHLGAYLIYLTALAHGMFAGTDTKNKWIFLMYIATFSTILVLMAVQLALVNGRKKAASRYAQTAAGKSGH